MNGTSERAVFALENRLGASWPNIHATERATEAALGQLQSAIASESTADTSIVVYGSLARREFTSDSDADWTLLVDGEADPQHLTSALQIERAIKAVGIKQPGREGTFGHLTFSHDLVNYIGGEDDTNANTTRRILLLLESTCIGGSAAHRRVLRNVLTRYLAEDFGWVHGRNPRGVPRFLQNDIARYWRTMAVDFAYKQRRRGGEAWALRSTKLRLSRKLIYAAGLVYCFSCALEPELRSLGPGDPSRIQRTSEYLWGLSQKPPTDLLAELFLTRPSLHDAAAEMFTAYDDFLGILQDSAAREHLEALAYEDAPTDDLYEKVRSLGHSFQHALDRLFLDPNEADLFDLTKTYGVF